MGLETLAITALAASAVGTGISAYNTYQAGKAQNRLAQMNAQQMEVDAETAARDGRIMANAQREQNARLLSKQRALYAKSGVVMSGTPLLVQAETAMELEKEALNVERTANIDAAKQRRAAVLERMGGKAAKRGATLGAIGTVLQGASQVAGQYTQFKSSGVI